MRTEIKPIFRVRGAAPEEALQILAEVNLGIGHSATVKTPGEVDKSPDEFQQINLLSLWIQEELDSLKLDLDYNADPDKIHFLAEAEYKMVYPQGVIDGQIIAPAHYRSVTGRINILKGNSSLMTLSALLHEMVHSASYQLVTVPKIGYMEPTVTGYGMETKNGKFFIGFNESLTEELSFRILRKHESTLRQDLGYTDKDFAEFRTSYGEFRQIMDGMLPGFPHHLNPSSAEYLDLLYKNMFTSNRDHLKVIAQPFGKNALIVLASMENKGMIDFMTKRELYCEYFAQISAERRGEIEQRLLPPTNA